MLQKNVKCDKLHSQTMEVKQYLLPVRRYIKNPVQTPSMKKKIEGVDILVDIDGCAF